MKRLPLCFSLLLAAACLSPLTACGYKGKLKSPSEMEAADAKKAQKEAKEAKKTSKSQKKPTPAPVETPKP